MNPSIINGDSEPGIAMPNAIIDQGYKGKEIALWLHLAPHFGETILTRKDIAKMMGYKASPSISKDLDRLIEDGFLTETPMYKDELGDVYNYRGISCRYIGCVYTTDHTPENV